MERSLEGMSVLCVDDDPDALELFATTLARLGAEVKSASTVEAAMQILATWKPDAVLCDLHLPDEDGYDLLHRVRANPALADLPLIAISGSHPDLEREKSLAAGFADHLVKPTRIRDIVTVVSQVVAAA
jgi:CheY-like chemotaxis protein